MLRQRPTCLTTALGVLLLASTAAAQSNRSPIPDFVPDYHFQGSQLTGWRTVGQAQWRAQNGEIIGTANAGGGGGWVVLDRPLQDVGFYTRFRCASECNTGVLLRAEQTPQGMKGIFVSLNPSELGNYAVTIDNTGRIVTRERLRNAGGQVRFAPAPNPNQQQGGGGGGGGAGGAAAATPPPPFRADDWNTLLVNLDADLIRPSLNGAGRIPSSATADSSRGFGPIALYVGGPGEVRFSAVSVKDLGNRKVSAEQVGPNFRASRLDDLHYAWDAAVADINRDGQNDIVSGPYYYLGPDFTTRREIYPGRSYNPSTEYVPNMVTHAADFTGDGWPDVLATESRPMVLYVNPKGEPRRWTRHPVLPGVTTENTLIRDLNGDGRLEVIYGIGGGIAYASPDPANPTAPWPVRRISAAGTASVNVHGLGTGDVNGDGRMDVLIASAWYEQPANLATAEVWREHKVDFAGVAGVGGRGGGDMAVFDANGDGVNDVVAALDAHGWGLAWFEQKRGTGGAESTWTPHLIMGNFATTNAGDVIFSELHSGVTPADINGDGLMDFVTGKRYWAHQDSYTDPDPHGDAVIYWYRTVRDPQAPGGARFVPELIHNRSGVGSAFEVMDVNNDGTVDIVSSGKLGTFVFWGTQRGRVTVAP